MMGGGARQFPEKRRYSPVAQNWNFNRLIKRHKKQKKISPEAPKTYINCNTHIYFSYDSDCISERRREKVSVEEGGNRRQWLSSSTHDVANIKDKVVFVSYNILGVQNAFNHSDMYQNVPHKYMKWRYRKKRLCEEISQFNADILCLQTTKDKVVFVSYNILGVQNAFNHSDMYQNVPHKYMKWRYRKKRLCEEISQFNADILCLQATKAEVRTTRVPMKYPVLEVDRFDDLENLLQNDGFVGVYQARTGETWDGCAVFWKNELFTLLHEEKIVFQKFGLRNNVAQLCVLKKKQNQSDCGLDAETSQQLSSQILLVGNIHVLFNQKRGDMKLGQVRIFLEKAHELSLIWGNIPVILGGDFNSTPQLNLQLHNRRNMSGALGPESYGHFQSQSTHAARVWGNVPRIRPYIWGGEELKLATGNNKLSFLKHPLNLSSAYLGVCGNCTTRDNCGEPLATSYHSMFIGTVDYIWHSPELLPIRVLDTLPLVNLRKTGGLPCKEFGSDHLALVCELAFVDTDDGT